MRSTVSAAAPAAVKAFFAAATASVVVVSVPDAMRRAQIPVRVRIHSSFVSIPLRASSRASSSLVTLFTGSALPVPVMREKTVKAMDSLFSDSVCPPWPISARGRESDDLNKERDRCEPSERTTKARMSDGQKKCLPLRACVRLHKNQALRIRVNPLIREAEKRIFLKVSSSLRNPLRP